MIFLIVGPDTYRARERVRALRDKFEREVDASGLNVHTINGATLTETEISHAFDSSPLLARRRFIVIDNLLKNKGKKVHEAVLKRLEEERDEATGNIVVLYEEQPPTGGSPLFQWLMKNARAQTFNHLSGSALRAWLKQYAEVRGRTLVSAAEDEFLSLHNNDLWGLVNDFNKVDSSLPVGSPITDADVRAMCVDGYNDDIFALVDAVVAGDTKNASSVMMDHITNGLSPQQLVALLEKQLSVLIRIQSGDLAPAGVHPYVVKKLSASARQTSKEKIIEAYRLLSELDISLKSSAIPPQTLLLQYLAHTTART